jgi:hypothetical protein
VDVANPVSQELECLELLLVGRIGRCQHGKVVLDRGHDALFSQRAFVIADLRHTARNIDEVLGRTIIQLAVGDRLLETLITFDAEAADLEPEPDDEEEGPPIVLELVRPKVVRRMRVRASG